jgi:hypothetical protein
MNTTKRFALFMIPAALLLQTVAQAEETKPAGTVVDTEFTEKYTYVQIDTAGKQTWYAVPAHEFSIGEKVIAPSDGLPMKDFYSRTLDRTFEMVYFVSSIASMDAPQAQALPPDHPPIHATPSSEAPDFSSIERPDGGKTIAEIFQQQDALAGETVLVRGISVKVSNGILGRNWIHLRDGSGAEGSNDLTITTTGIVQAGSVVTLKGTLRKNQDFGAGYKYDLLLENAEIQP